MNMSDLMTKEAQVLDPEESIKSAARMMKGFDIGSLRCGGRQAPTARR
jgi:CBS domain-containing protein